MAIASSLKDFNLFVEGRGYAGKVDELNLPKLTIKTDEYRAGGMDAPIEMDMGMEKIECDLTLRDYDAATLSLFGVQIGLDASFRANGSIQSPTTGLAIPVVVVMRGRIKEVDMGTWKSGDAATMKLAVALQYYKYTQAGKDLIEIDVEGMRRVINGVDQLAQTRLNLGMV